VVSIKALDTLTPADLWRQVPLEEEFWEEARERQRRVLKVLLEETLEDEQLELLAAGRYRRVETRQGYRNGFYERDLATQIGIVLCSSTWIAKRLVGLVEFAHAVGGGRVSVDIRVVLSSEAPVRGLNDLLLRVGG